MNSITHSNVLSFCGIMNNLYSYDAVSNGLSVVNKAAFPVKGISTVIDGIPMEPDCEKIIIMMDNAMLLYPAKQEEKV